MSYPANTLGGQIKLSSQIQQVGPTLSFGGVADNRPSSILNLATNFSSRNATLSEDSYDTLCAWRGNANDAGIPVYFNSSTDGNKVVDVFGNKVQLARVVGLIIVNLSTAAALDVLFTWTDGPVLGTTPKLRLRPKSAKSDSFHAFTAPDAAGYAVSGTSEADFITVKNVTSGANNLYDILVAGIAA